MCASLSRFSYPPSAKLPTRLDRDTGPTIAIGPQLVKVLLILVAEFFEKGP
jgi:hypothetical protein